MKKPVFTLGYQHISFLKPYLVFCSSSAGCGLLINEAKTKDHFLQHL